MPYKGKQEGTFEKADRLGHTHIINDDAVWEAAKSWRYPVAFSKNNNEIETIPLPPDEPEYPYQYCLAIDGSVQQQPISPEFPAIQFGSLQIGVTRIKLEELIEHHSEFINPVQQKKAIRTDYINGLLPGGGIWIDTMTPEQTWRYSVYQLFKDTKIRHQRSKESDADFARVPSIFDIFIEIWGDTPFRLLRCPNAECSYEEISEITIDGSSRCPICHCSWYPTDVLRTHDEYKSGDENTAPILRIMNILERILMCAQISKHPYGNMDKDIKQWMFMTDGPLAIFGTAAKFHRNILRYWQRKGADAPLLIGVEKSGLFADHALSISKYIDPGQIVVLSQTYIKKWITKKTVKSKQYGLETFYGRRFIYKTKREDIIVFTIPPLSGHPYQTKENDIFDQQHYPTLFPACHMLDRLHTDMYANSLIPITLAHKAAALPIGIGSNVLTHKMRNIIGNITRNGAQ